MKKAFMLITLNATSAQQEKIGTAFKMYGWWHYFPQSWVLIDPLGLMSIAKISETVRNECPGLTHMVFEVNRTSGYAGFANPEWATFLEQEFRGMF